MPTSAAGQVADTCEVHLQGANFVGAAADLARILDLQDTTSQASFAVMRSGRGYTLNACAAPRSVSDLARSLATDKPADRIQLLPAELYVTGNSAYPRDWNDGILWSGRGLNASITAGARFQWGPLSAALAPVAAWQSNSDFDMVLSADTTLSAFANPFSSGIDRPQRFGAGSFSRLDAGQSYARVDVRGFGAGLSTENIRWGPSRRNPLLLSGTASGFAHVFIEANRPADIWIGDLEFQVFWGRLEESDYFDSDPDNDARVLAGVLVALQPRPFDGLTIGAMRLQSLTWWPELSLSDVLLRPYRGVGNNPSGRSGDNQMLGLFFRFASTPGGLEAYGEWAREDHWGNWSGLFRNLDASQAWTLGLQKVIRRGNDALRLGAEVTHLSDALPIRFAGRGGGVGFYTNSTVTQGHTHRGQLLGAALGTGGESLFLGGDYFWRGGRTSLSVERARYEDDTYTVRFADRYGAHARDTELSIRAGHLVLLGAMSLDVEAGWSVRYNRSFLDLDALAPGEPYRRENNWGLRLGARWTPAVAQ